MAGEGTGKKATRKPNSAKARLNSPAYKNNATRTRTCRGCDDVKRPDLRCGNPKPKPKRRIQKRSTTRSCTSRNPRSGSDRHRQNQTRDFSISSSATPKYWSAARRDPDTKSPPQRWDHLTQTVAALTCIIAPLAPRKQPALADNARRHRDKADSADCVDR